MRYSNKYISHNDSQVRWVFRSVIQRLGGETRVKQVSFQVFPEGCDRETVSYLKGERVPKNRGIVTERIWKVFDWFVNCTIKSGDVKELKFLCVFESCWRYICLFCLLFGVLRHFQHCTGHITTGSWKGRGNQYIQFVRVLYCKLPTNGKQLPTFHLRSSRESNPGLRGGRRECYHSATMAPCWRYKVHA